MVNESLKTGICDFARKKPINLTIKENFNGFFGTDGSRKAFITSHNFSCRPPSLI